MDWYTYCETHKFYYTVKPSCQDITAFDMRRVYPLQQDNVRNVYYAVKDIPYIKSVTVFGSSISKSCNINSDLDLCIEMMPNAEDSLRNKVRLILNDVVDCDIDILWYDHLTYRDKVYLDIKKGLVIK